MLIKRLELTSSKSANQSLAVLTVADSLSGLLVALMYIYNFSQMDGADLFLDTECMVIKDVQKRAYQEEINCLNSAKP